MDQDGFEYCVNQTLGGWCSTEKVFHLNRRRRWYRTRVLKGEPIPDEKKVPLSLSVLIIPSESSLIQQNLILFESSSEENLREEENEVGR